MFVEESTLNALRRDFRAITADGTATSVMMGIGENYFPPFVLAISSSQLASGLVSSVPIVIGAALQMVAPCALKRIGSYRRWVVLCSAVQALAMIPLAIAALRGSMSVPAVFAFVAVYWGSGMAGGSAWNAWVGTIVPEQCRPRYFAWRTRMCQAGMLAGFLFGGLALQLGVSCGEQLGMFVLLFAVATGSRFVSVAYLTTQSEPVPPDAHVRLPTRAELTSFLGRRGVGRVFLYLLAVQAAVQISGPYFPPYMLRQLGLSYGSYMVLIGVAFAAKIVFLPAMGRLVDRWGTTRLLWIGGIGLIPLSSLWILSDHFAYLLGLQILSGAAWAAYELAMLLLAFETIPREKRVGMLTVYNMANATAILLGSLVGGSILALLGEVRKAYWLLFLVSSTARLAAIPVLSGLPRWNSRSLAAAIGRAMRIRTEAAASKPAIIVLQGPHWRHPRATQPRLRAFRSESWESDHVTSGKERL